MDIPSECKIHQNIIPRIGGIGIIVGTLLPVFIWIWFSDFPLTNLFLAYFVGVIILFIIGILDDFLNLHYRYKLLGQFFAASFVIIIGNVHIANLGIWTAPNEILLPNLIAIPLTLFFIVGVTNALNLADGLDGLAAGISIFIFASLAVISYLDGRIDLLLSCFAIIGSILAFLRYNSFPAIVFMGDTGSLFLGFSAAVIAIYLTQTQSTALAKTLPIMILGLPILDTLYVFIVRIVRKEPPFKRDLKHLHYQLLRLGFSHKHAVIVIYLIQAFLVYLSIKMRYFTEPWIVLTYCSVIFCIFLLLFLAKRFSWNIFVEKNIKSNENVYFSKSFYKLLKKFSFTYITIILPLGIIGMALFSQLDKMHSIIIALSSTLFVAFLSRKHSGLFSLSMRLTSYILIMYLLLSSQEYSIFQLPFSLRHCHHFFWGSIAIAVFLYLFATRFESLETTPLDYIILFIVLFLPFVPVDLIGKWHLGTVSGGLLVFFWSSELLLRNQKKKLNFFSVGCSLSILIIFIRVLISD